MVQTHSDPRSIKMGTRETEMLKMEAVVEGDSTVHTLVSAVKVESSSG